MILCERLEQWFLSYREQAGAQSKRGCLEHIVSLRYWRLTLFVLSIDFTKAYDLVPKRVLFEILKRLGCGMVTLSVLVAMYTLLRTLLARL